MNFKFYQSLCNYLLSLLYLRMKKKMFSNEILIYVYPEHINDIICNSRDDNDFNSWIKLYYDWKELSQYFWKFLCTFTSVACFKYVVRSAGFQYLLFYHLWVSDFHTCKSTCSNVNSIKNFTKKMLVKKFYKGYF